jgi:hypothetical protein
MPVAVNSSGLVTSPQHPSLRKAMPYRRIWTDADFAEMGWHDAAVYSMSFPQADSALRFDIDYIFKWHWAADKAEGWDLAPCTLEFLHVSGLQVALAWERRGDTTILDITRHNSKLTPNGQFTEWDYEIELDVGKINFRATGYKQTLRNPPIFSASQSLGR